MDVKIIEIPVAKIKDEKSFHKVFAKAFGFPDFYGANGDAWIDCMTYLDDKKAGMTNVHVKKGGQVIIKIKNFLKFKHRCLDLCLDMEDWIAFVNYRRIKAGQEPILSLMLIDKADYNF